VETTEFRCRNCNVPTEHVVLDSRGGERVRWFCGYCELPNKAYEEIYQMIRWATSLEALDQAAQKMVQANIPKQLKEYRELVKAGQLRRQVLSENGKN
jgi:hypothetical protein